MSLQTWKETLITAQVDGTARTAAAAASLLPAAALFTLPANFFAIGKQLVIEASGRLSTVVTTPGTWRFDVRFGATVVADTTAGAFNAATNAYTNVGWYIRLVLTCRAIGAAANLMHQGIFTCPNIIKTADVAMPNTGLNALLPYNTAPAVGNNFDSTATQQVDFFWTQTVATGSVTLHQYSLSVEN